jgi:hypothetical protein
VRTPETLDLSGQYPWTLDEGAVTRFHPFAIDWVDRDGDILLHFNPRPDEKRIVLNSRLDGRWHEEASAPRWPFTLEPNLPFRARFEVQKDRFRIFVDERHLCDFIHRASPLSIIEARSTTFLWRLAASASRRPRACRSFYNPGRAILPKVVPAEAGHVEQSWVVEQEAPEVKERVESFSLFAILCTWMEEDVIASTVANCIAQGCDRVYVIDNGSTDRTIERALQAGAELAGTFDHGDFDDDEKTRQMQAAVDRVSSVTQDEHVWWLWLDADEFYEGPSGLTVREYLASLDRSFRVVGARFLNHFPDGKPAYVEGHNPLEFRSRYHEIPGAYCSRGHFKHPLQRWSRGEPEIRVGGGFHTASSAGQLLEPTRPVICHHIPYREEQATRERLLRLVGADGGHGRLTHAARGPHMRLRLQSLDAIYRGRWGEVDYFWPCVRGFVPELEHWAPVSQGA